MDFKYNNRHPVITPCQIEKNLIPDESKQINVLIQMKNDNKSDDTIRFTRKALSRLSRHASLKRKTNEVLVVKEESEVIET